MYVFGIDWPIMELLFIVGTLLLIFGVFLFITLIVIWLEIRKLRELILTERSNIYRFEWDINQLKSEEKKKHAKNLEEFIKNAFEKGFTESIVRSILLKKGWPCNLVDNALKKNNK